MNSKIASLEQQIVDAVAHRSDRSPFAQNAVPFSPSAADKQATDSLGHHQANSSAQSAEFHHLQSQVVQLSATVTRLDAAMSVWAESRPHETAQVDNALSRILTLENELKAHQALPEAVEKLTKQVCDPQAARQARNDDTRSSAVLEAKIAAIHSEVEQLSLEKSSGRLDEQQGNLDHLASDVAALATRVLQLEPVQQSTAAAADSLAQRLQVLEDQVTPFLHESQELRSKLSSLSAEAMQHLDDRNPGSRLLLAGHSTMPTPNAEASQSSAVESALDQAPGQGAPTSSASQENVENKLEALSKALSSLQQASEHAGLLELARNGKEGSLVHAVACAHTEDCCAQAIQEQAQGIQSQLKTVQESVAAARAEAINAQQAAGKAASRTISFQQDMNGLLQRIELLEDVAEEFSGSSDVVAELRGTMQQLQAEGQILSNVHARLDDLSEQVLGIDGAVNQAKKSITEHSQLLEGTEERLKKTWEKGVADLNALSQDRSSTLQPSVEAAMQQSRVAQNIANRIQQEIQTLRQTITDLQHTKQDSDSGMSQVIQTLERRLNSVEEKTTVSMERTSLQMERLDRMKVRANQQWMEQMASNDILCLWAAF
jgi:chromosome segregation ATPase